MAEAPGGLTLLVDRKRRARRARERLAGLAAVVRQLTGFEAPAVAWERNLLGARVRDYRPEWLDEMTLRGEAVWGRLWGSGRAPVRSTPICVLPRDEFEAWSGLAGRAEATALGWRAQAILAALRSKGATFPQDLARDCGPLPSDLEAGLAELLGLGLATNDSFAALRELLLPPWKRRDRPLRPTGRWSLFRQEAAPAPPPEFVARALLRRYGVVFRAVLARERQPLPWRDLLRAFRTMELRGEVRGGRFVAGFAGEQFALPPAVEVMRDVRRKGPRPPVRVSAADPIQLRGILTPEERVPAAEAGAASIA